MRKVFVLLSPGTQQLNEAAQIFELKTSVIKQEIERIGIRKKNNRKIQKAIWLSEAIVF